MRRQCRRYGGQVLTEYVIMLLLLTLIAMSVLGFSHYFSMYGGRIVDSVSIDCP